MSKEAVPCGCYSIIFAVNCFLGWLTFDYCLWAFTGKDIPWYGDIFLGLIIGSFTLPLSIVLWILDYFGVIVLPFM